MSAVLRWSPLPEIRCNGRPDVRGHGEAIRPGTLAVHHDLSRAPVDVIEVHRYHLSGPQSEPGQQHEDRVVSSAERGVPVAASQQAIDLVLR